MTDLIQHIAIVENTLVSHKSFKYGLKRLEQCLRNAEYSPEPSCLMIIDETRTGKSRMLEEHCHKHRPFRAEQGRTVPIVHIRTPSKHTIKAHRQRPSAINASSYR